MGLGEKKEGETLSSSREYGLRWPPLPRPCPGGEGAAVAATADDPAALVGEPRDEDGGPEEGKVRERLVVGQVDQVVEAEVGGGDALPVVPVLKADEEALVLLRVLAEHGVGEVAARERSLAADDQENGTAKDVKRVVHPVPLRPPEIDAFGNTNT